MISSSPIRPAICLCLGLLFVLISKTDCSPGPEGTPTPTRIERSAQWKKCKHECQVELKAAMKESTFGLFTCMKTKKNHYPVPTCVARCVGEPASQQGDCWCQACKENHNIFCLPDVDPHKHIEKNDCEELACKGEEKAITLKRCKGSHKHNNQDKDPTPDKTPEMEPDLDEHDK